MKKRILALICAISMVLPIMFVSVANAEILDTGISVVFDTEKSTAEKAVFNVYVKGYTDVYGLQFQVKTSANLAIKDTTITKHIYQNDTSAFNATYNGMNKNLVIRYASTAAPMAWDSSQPIVTWEIPVATTLTADDPLTVTKQDIKTGSATASTVQAAVSVDPAQPVSAGGDDEDVVTTYFATESAVQTGKTPYWYATIGGVNKKKAATWDANVEGGSAKFGLIFTGSETISDMSIAWE